MLFIAGLVLAASGWVSPPVALALGIVVLDAAEMIERVDRYQ